VYVISTINIYINISIIKYQYKMITLIYVYVEKIITSILINFLS